MPKVQCGSPAAVDAASGARVCSENCCDLNNTRDNTSSKPDLLSAALKYAEAGLKVFPCVKHGKEPITGNGFKDATTNSAQIREWWTRWQSANIGLPMKPNGLVAVDPDQYKPDCGWDEFARSITVPDTWQQRTGNGGLHIIFTAPPHADFPGLLAPDVDIKSNGYIIVAPSTLGPNKHYQRITDHGPAPAPDWLLTAKGVARNGGGGGGGGGPLNWVTNPETGLVTDGREAFLTHLVFEARFEGTNADELAALAWERFQEGADLTRECRMSHREALRKAHAVLRKFPRRRLLTGVKPDPWPKELPKAEAYAQLSSTLDGFITKLSWKKMEDS